MAWVFLLLAGLLEVVWAWSMKASDGFSRPLPSIVTVVAMLGSFWLLAAAMRTVPLGTAYPIWTGIGAVGTFAIGIAFLAEPVNATRVLAASLIVAGIVLMKVAAP